MAKKKKQRSGGASVSTPKAAAQPARAVDSRRGLWLAVGLLVVATVVAYWPVLGAEFVRFDDTAYVTDNLIVQRGLTAEGWRWAWTTFAAANWHPLTWLSHMLDCELYGLDAGGHHRTNLLLHLAATLALLAAWRRLTAGRGWGWWPGVLMAGLFALHPVHVESVAWISERKDVLSALFWMLTLWAYARHVERPGGGRYALVVAFFVLGLLAKPMLVTLPFVLLLLDVWPLGRWRAGWLVGEAEAAGLAAPRSVGFLLLEKLPLFTLAAASSAVTVVAQRSGGAVAPFEVFSLTERVANSVVTFGRYLGKLFWPSNLSVYYPHPGLPPAWLTVGMAIVLAGITLAVLLYWKRQPSLAIGWFWYLGTLVPVIGLVQVGAQAMADRYTYLPSVGWSLTIVGVAILLLRRRPALARPLAVAAVLWLAALAVGTRVQAAYWQDSRTLFERSLAVTEGNYLLHNNLGAYLLDRGDFAGAEEHLREALRIQPAYAEAESNLGLALARRGDLAAAIEHYRRAIQLDSGYATAYNNLASALAESGRPQEAIEPLRTSLRLDPRQVEAHGNLANALAQTGRLDEALEEYREALDLDPGYATGHANYGNALVTLGRLEEAERALREAVRLAPDDAVTRVNLATVLADRGQLDAALAELHRAVELAPDLPQARFFLGLGALQKGDVQTAQEQIQALFQLEPAMARQLLAQVEGG